MNELLRQFAIIADDMWRRRWIGLAVAWVVAVAGAVMLWLIPDRYETTARVYVDTQTVLKPLMHGLAVQPNIDEQIGMLARTIIARPNIEKIMHSANHDWSLKQSHLTVRHSKNRPTRRSPVATFRVVRGA